MVIQLVLSGLHLFLALLYRVTGHTSDISALSGLLFIQKDKGEGLRVLTPDI